MIYKNLKPNIADAIKESCYRTDARLYNIANGVHNISTGIEHGMEVAKDLAKIIDKTVKEAVALDCDLSVIVKGIMLGAFRSSPFVRQEAHKTIRLLVDEILQPVFKYKGRVKQALEGLLAAAVIIAKEFKLNLQEVLVVVREDILSSANTINPGLGEEVKEVLSNIQES